ncbi:polysaccharide biosynthesis/export family protein [Corticibacterium sp. UT-5YL-CI-8]|nr:polysaccharide biosynthesis/export family protein [Tianweitania sp. UT-5YL-CI-8]
MHTRIVIAGFCTMAICAGAQARDLYRLEQGDQVELWNSVDASMRRTLTIGPDGWLSLPLAGHLEGAGLTLPELETEIKGRLRRFFNEEPDLTLMLVPGTERVQSIYVSGDVATPGAYPFRPGLLVAHGLSMAGGARRAAAEASDEERSITIRGDIGRMKARISALIAQAARIEAEKSDTPAIEAPAAMTTDIEREQAILDIRLADKADKAKVHTQRLALRSDFANALTEQVKAIDLQVELSGKRLEGISKLVAKGFANEVQQIELKSDIADLQARRHELEGQITTARLEMSAEIEEFRQAQAERTTQLMLELRDTQGNQDAAQSSLKDSERVLRLLDMAPQSDAEEKTVQTTFRIVRSVNGSPVEIDASEMSELQPGDLVRVIRSDDAAATTPASAERPVNEQRSPS